MIYGPAVREGHAYKYENTLTQHIGPNHPNGAKSALVAITTNGTMKLIFQQYNNKYTETTHEIESITSSNALITHASVCSDRCEP